MKSSYQTLKEKLDSIWQELEDMQLTLEDMVKDPKSWIGHQSEEDDIKDIARAILNSVYRAERTYFK